MGFNLHLCDLSALVIASENSESVFEADLQGNKECHSLNRVVTTIDVVTHEQVVRIRWLSTNFEQLSKVMELSVDVSADCDGRTYLLDIRLINKDFFCLNQIQKLTVVQNCLVSDKSAKGSILPEGAIKVNELGEKGCLELIRP